MATGNASMKVHKKPVGQSHEEFARGRVKGSLIRQIILGGQDGLVNVMGIILGVATATGNARLVLIAGLAATFAESISMAAVAYTSAKAQREFYQKRVQEEQWEIKVFPKDETNEIRAIYAKKGFRGKLLEEIVKNVVSDKKRWVDEMMLGEHKMTETDFDDPVQEATVVGISAFIGSLVPLFPFFFLAAWPATIASVVVSGIVLFVAGAVKTRYVAGTWLKGGLEMMAIGVVSGLAGYVIGLLMNVTGI